MFRDGQGRIDLWTLQMNNNQSRGATSRPNDQNIRFIFELRMAKASDDASEVLCVDYYIITAVIYSQMRNEVRVHLARIFMAYVWWPFLDC